MMPAVIRDNLDYLLIGNLANGEPGGLLLTLGLSAAAALLASLLGLGLGIALLTAPTAVQRLLGALTALLRAIPVLMLIFWCYFLLPLLFGVDIPGMLTVILALALIHSAYLGQAVLAGLQAVGRGQWHAGLALGFSRGQTLRWLILPQALRIMLPSFVNQWISLLKDSSLAYIVGVAEFTFVATQVNNREQVYPLEIFCAIAIGYLALCGLLQFGGHLAGRRWKRLA
ncbi:amino acid ABC transporter permease [Chromobacterium sphagni]|uniref:ABC transporter permease n=1 Tax=Chromobacterium sphagni TaxID=1903179 RepID=A0A1S1X3X2_9NEIS|nr:amino acid ABC transporter permease [Chromobacterium sphagni]OHX14172.1 ABC transporter permease [Chromobacterium sphagni]OHX20374.1 ABC transporter permease [Chromobacterium sphagni]